VVYPPSSRDSTSGQGPPGGPVLLLLPVWLVWSNFSYFADLFDVDGSLYRVAMLAAIHDHRARGIRRRDRPRRGRHRVGHRIRPGRRLRVRGRGLPVVALFRRRPGRGGDRRHARRCPGTR